MPQINNAGLNLIRDFEGCSLTAYDDGTGVWTIGWGHTPATPGETITQEQADQMLLDDLQRFEQCVNDAVSHDINPNQFAALVSFAYNLGCGSLDGSTLLAMVNSGNYDGAAQQFGRWVYAGGQVLEGLVRRRAAEANLFERVDTP
jgi:lysozyme